MLPTPTQVIQEVRAVLSAAAQQPGGSAPTPSTPSTPSTPDAGASGPTIALGASPDVASASPPPLEHSSSASSPVSSEGASAGGSTAASPGPSPAAPPPPSSPAATPPPPGTPASSPGVGTGAEVPNPFAGSPLAGSADLMSMMMSDPELMKRMQNPRVSGGQTNGWLWQLVCDERSVTRSETKQAASCDALASSHACGICVKMLLSSINSGCKPKPLHRRTPCISWKSLQEIPGRWFVAGVHRCSRC